MTGKIIAMAMAAVTSRNLFYDVPSYPKINGAARRIVPLAELNFTRHRSSNHSCQFQSRLQKIVQFDYK